MKTKPSPISSLERATVLVLAPMGNSMRIKVVEQALRMAKEDGFAEARDMAEKIANDVEQNYRNGAYSLGIAELIRD